MLCVFSPDFRLDTLVSQRRKLGEAFAMGYAIKWDESYWASELVPDSAPPALYQQRALVLKQEREGYNS